MPTANHTPAAIDAHIEGAAARACAAASRVRRVPARRRCNGDADAAGSVVGATSMAELQWQAMTTMLHAQSLRACDALREVPMP